MPNSTVRAGLLAVVTLAGVFFGRVPVHAQTLPLGGIVTGGVRAAMNDTLRSKKHLDVTTDPNAGAAPADSSGLPPITDSDQTKAAFLLPAVDYQADLGVNFGEGPTGAQRHAEPGSVDGGVIVRVEPRTRIAAAYYQLSTNELGVDSGVIPIEIQGQGTLTQEDLNSFQPDATTKVEIYVFAIERLFTIAKSPLVFTLAYDSQTSRTFAGRGTITSYLDGNVQNLFIRTEQHYNVVFSEPFVMDDQKLFVLFSEQLQQLVHTAGFNQAPNRPQFLYNAYFQYDANDKTSFFFLPAKNVVYFPTDRYPQNDAVFLYGFTYKIKKPFFVQGTVTSITPTNPDYDNTGRIGITHVTIACPPNTNGTGLSQQCTNNILNLTTLPTFGGTKLTTIKLSVGIGTPPVYIPF